MEAHISLVLFPEEGSGADLIPAVIFPLAHNIRPLTLIREAPKTRGSGGRQFPS